ncbi:hypothetical protein SCHPADRAFT_893576 [Schizopora paradoxa]|uniref:Uncharacterized protein n=1 Tax=Schizopora paradoxa TaxID=27342 RepID=A0A0H2RAG4_9AGAM|nr:hypothetical protein SCHPADRAFT_893576 [Schizopora paradoxa]
MGRRRASSPAFTHWLSISTFSSSRDLLPHPRLSTLALDLLPASCVHFLAHGCPSRRRSQDVSTPDERDVELLEATCCLMMWVVVHPSLLVVPPQRRINASPSPNLLVTYEDGTFRRPASDVMRSVRAGFRDDGRWENGVSSSIPPYIIRLRACHVLVAILPPRRPCPARRPPPTLRACCLWHATRRRLACPSYVAAAISSSLSKRHPPFSAVDRTPPPFCRGHCLALHASTGRIDVRRTEGDGAGPAWTRIVDVRDGSGVNGRRRPHDEGQEGRTGSGESHVRGRATKMWGSSQHAVREGGSWAGLRGVTSTKGGSDDDHDDAWWLEGGRSDDGSTKTGSRGLTGHGTHTSTRHDDDAPAIPLPVITPPPPSPTSPDDDDDDEHGGRLLLVHVRNVPSSMTTTATTSTYVQRSGDARPLSMHTIDARAGRGGVGVDRAARPRAGEMSRQQAASTPLSCFKAVDDFGFRVDLTAFVNGPHLTNFLVAVLH